MCYSPENSNTKSMLWRGFWKLRANLQRKQRLSRRFSPKLLKTSWETLDLASVQYHLWNGNHDLIPGELNQPFCQGNSLETYIITLEQLKTVALNWKHGGITTVWAVSSDFLFTGRNQLWLWDSSWFEDKQCSGSAGRCPVRAVVNRGEPDRGSTPGRAPRCGDITYTAASGGIQNLTLSLYYSVGPLKFKAAWRRTETVRSEGHGWRKSISAKIVLPTSEVKSNMKL